MYHYSNATATPRERTRRIRFRRSDQSSEIGTEREAAVEHRNDRRLRPVRVLRSRGLRAGRKRPVHCTVRLRLETYLVELRDCYQIFSARESNILSSPARSVILFSVGSFNSDSGSCCILLSPFRCFLPSQSSIATRAHSIRLVSMRFQLHQIH